MLVISRYRDESLVIGDAVVTVLWISPSVVRIGITAPHRVEIRRLEVDYQPPLPPQHQPEGGQW